ncbi:MAG: hypothetical protein AAF465_15915 [Pseudomonadota bacterium]
MKLFTAPALIVFFCVGCDQISMASCLEQHASMTCINKKLLKNSPSLKIEPDSTIAGRSDLYTVWVSSAEWVHMFPKQERKEDLVLLHQSGRAMFQIETMVPSSQSLAEIAKKPISDLSEKLNAEPTNIPVPTPVYAEGGGVLFEICYYTKEKAIECMYSAALNLGKATIKIFSHTEEDEAVIEQIMTLFVSVEPKRNGD